MNSVLNTITTKNWICFCFPWEAITDITINGDIHLLAIKINGLCKYGLL